MMYVITTFDKSADDHFLIGVIYNVSYDNMRSFNINLHKLLCEYYKTDNIVIGDYSLLKCDPDTKVCIKVNSEYCDILITESKNTIKL